MEQRTQRYHTGAALPPWPQRPRFPRRGFDEVADPYLTFWRRYVAPLVSSGGVATSDSRRLWRKVIAPRLDQYMGEVFGSVCRDFVRDGRISRFKPVRTGRWWNASTQNEIDIVSTDASGRVLAGECKWGQIDSHDLRTLRERAALMTRELKEEVSSVRYALFCRHAPTDPSLLRGIESGQVAWYSPSSLFK